MAESALVSQDDLAKAMGYEPEQTSRIAKQLRDQGIKYLYGKDGRIWTTAAAINQAVLAPGNMASHEALRIDKVQQR